MKPLLILLFSVTVLFSGCAFVDQLKKVADELGKVPSAAVEGMQDATDKLNKLVTPDEKE